MDMNFCLYAYSYAGSSYKLLNMPVGNLAQIRNFKLHWTRVSRGSMGATMRAVDFSVHMAQGSNATKTVDIYGKGDEQALREIEDVVRSVNGKIGYEILDWKLEKKHLREFEKTVNRHLRSRYFVE